MGTVTVRPGEPAVFTVILAAAAPRPIRLVSIRLIPIPGVPTPRLAHVALLGPSMGYPAYTRDWPPSGGPGGRPFPIRPFYGVTVWPAERHHRGLPPAVLYAVVGTVPNTIYAVAGVRLGYVLDGRSYTAALYAAGEACVFPSPATTAQFNWCGARSDTLFKQVSKLAGSAPG